MSRLTAVARAIVDRVRAAAPAVPLDVEIHVPIGPTPAFFTMLHYFAAGLRLNGGSLAGSRIVATVGADCEPEDLSERLPWTRKYGIEWRWLDRDLYRRHIYYATAVERFRHPFRARMVMLLDVDTFVTGEFRPVVESCSRGRALAGLIAHVSPFSGLGMPTPLWWSRLFRTAGLPPPRLVAEHTGWGTMSHEPADRYCPPYFNLGALIAPAAIMTQIGSIIYAEMAHVDSVVEIVYKCQLALTLAIQRLGLPWLPLAMRYNFPNREDLAARYTDDLADVRLFHYLRQDQVERTRDFASPQHVASLLARDDLNAVNLEMARRLAPIHEAVLADPS